MSRYTLDLNEISAESVLVPVGNYPMKIAKADVNTGISEKTDKPWANLSLQLIITDPEVVSLLNIDEPRVFYSGWFAFSKDDGKFMRGNCPEIGQFIKVTGFTNSSDFEDDNTEEAETERDYILALFSNMAAACVGTDCIGKVIQTKHNNDKSKLVNSVSKISKV